MTLPMTLPMTELDESLAAVLSGVLGDLRVAARVPALSAAVGRGGEVAWAGAAGAPALAGTDGDPTPEHAFRIGSITKTMLAVVVMRLVEEGKVALHDPIGAHLPDAPAADATVAELLSHSSGLPAEPPGAWWERAGGPTWEQLVASAPPQLRAPGTWYHYSNVGYAVLGRLVEQARGRAWDDALRDELWAPLGMTATGRVPVGRYVTGYAVHPHADLVHVEPVAEYLALGAAGELWSTPSDLVRFGMWLTCNDTLGATGDAVLPPAARRLMTAPRVVVDEPGPAWTGAYGLGVRVRKDLLDPGVVPAGGGGVPGSGGVPGGGGAPWGAEAITVRTVGHSGSVPGFTADLRIDLETGDAVAVCGSSTAGMVEGIPLLAVLRRARGAGEPGGVRPGVGGPGAAGLGAVGSDVAGSAVAGRSDAAGPRAGGRADVGPWAAALTGTWYWGPAPYTLRAEGGRLVLSGSAGRRSMEFAPGEVPGTWVGVTAGYWQGETLRRVERGGRVVALDLGTFCFTRAPYDPDVEIPGGHDGVGWHVL